jgi:hypothetical protein
MFYLSDRTTRTFVHWKRCRVNQIVSGNSSAGIHRLRGGCRESLGLLRRKKLERRRELNRIAKRAIERAAHGVDSVDAVNRLPTLFRSDEVHQDVYPANDENAFFRFYLTCYVGDEFAVACVNLARFQRTSEGSHHSAGSGGDHIIDGRSV